MVNRMSAPSNISGAKAHSEKNALSLQHFNHVPLKIATLFRN